VRQNNRSASALLREWGGYDRSGSEAHSKLPLGPRPPNAEAPQRQEQPDAAVRRAALLSPLPGARASRVAMPPCQTVAAACTAGSRRPVSPPPPGSPAAFPATCRSVRRGARSTRRPQPGGMVNFRGPKAVARRGALRRVCDRWSFSGNPWAFLMTDERMRHGTPLAIYAVCAYVAADSYLARGIRDSQRPPALR
jgi:hypothetical protein